MPCKLLFRILLAAWLLAGPGGAVWPAVAQSRGDAIIAVLASEDALRTQFDDLVAFVAAYRARYGVVVCVIERRECNPLMPFGSGAADDIAGRVRALIEQTARSVGHGQGPLPTVEQLRLVVNDEVAPYFERYLREAQAGGSLLNPADRSLRLVVAADDFAIFRNTLRQTTVRTAMLSEGCFGSGLDATTLRSAALPAEADVTLHFLIAGGGRQPAPGFPPHAVEIISRVLGEGTERRGQGGRHIFTVVQSASACSDIAVDAARQAAPADAACNVVAAPHLPAFAPLACAPPGPASAAPPRLDPPRLDPPRFDPPRLDPPRPDAPPAARTPRPGPDPRTVTRLAEAAPSASAVTAERDVAARAGSGPVVVTLAEGAGELAVAGPNHAGMPTGAGADGEVASRAPGRIELKPRAAPGTWRIFLRLRGQNGACPGGLVRAGKVTVQGGGLVAAREISFEARASQCSAEGPLVFLGTFEVAR